MEGRNFTIDFCERKTWCYLPSEEIEKKQKKQNKSNKQLQNKTAAMKTE